MRRSRKYLAPASALAGAGLLAWLIAGMGPARLLELWNAIRPVLPILVALTGLRYGLQAAGWRLATRAKERPGWGPTLGGVVAGEAAGYVAGGMLAREPIKLLFVRDRVPTRVALAGAAVERLASISASAALIATALTLVAFGRAPRVLTWSLGAALVASIAWIWKRRYARPRANRADAEAPQGTVRNARAVAMDVAIDLWRNRSSALAAIAALGLAQEAVNVTEAYLVLTWIGADPFLATVVAFEGVSRAANAVVQFVPGRVGVAEATSALVAGTVHLNPAYGLSLALARRGRSLLWAVVGLSLLIVRNVPRVQHRPAQVASE